MELHNKLTDLEQDPNAILYHLQRRCQAEGKTEVANKLHEGAQRISKPGPILSLLGHLHNKNPSVSNLGFENPRSTAAHRLAKEV